VDITFEFLLIWVIKFWFRVQIGYLLKLVAFQSLSNFGNFVNLPWDLIELIMQQNDASLEGVIYVKLMMHPNSRLGSIMCNLAIHHFCITINQYYLIADIVNFMALFKFSCYAWLDYV
jgi:hypothetical protein